MLNKEFKFSTKWKVPQIIEKIESVTTGKSLNWKKKISQPYYFSGYDNSGFTLIRSGYRLGVNLIISKFIEQESKTDIVVVTKPSFGTFVAFIFFIGLMFIFLFEYNVFFDLKKLITLVIIFLIPIVTVYLNLLSDVKKAKLFLAEFFEINDLSLFRDNK